ncbi:hypothetical protein BDR06DRAFT_982445 [Suillus hirtellus]|nr:hypothetical protein BDR06DRAFT_982445 [Suillus hirtellus]
MSPQDNGTQPLSSWPTIHLSSARMTIFSTAKATSFIIHISQKRANQWCRWSEDVIPCMIVPYLSYIQETISLCHANMPAIHHWTDGECRTGCRTHSIKEITIITCPCLPAPLQLLCCMFFPCAPMASSLASICLLFLCQSPNQTVWCDVLEIFLDRMKYNNAFHWYQDHISTLVIGSQKDGAPVDQPSDYLYSQCPLCFGGNNWPDFIICIDVCFTQKHSANPCGATGSDPPNPTPSFFLLTDDVKAMENFVERCCRDRQQARTLRVEPDEDSYEEGMCIPVSVLNGCGNSFIAADEKWKKASTCFFTDTSLMALVCRHDREKQHYMNIGLFCRKWNFLDDSTLSHITFAVAVFHAYEGFSLSDGEGYEGLWSFLKPLIPSLHVSEKNDALDCLHELELDENMLCVEWKAQVDHQMRPTLCINKAAEVITIILALEKTLQTQEASIHKPKMQFHTVCVPDIGEVNLQLVDAQSQYRKTADTLQYKVNLEKIKKDIYLIVHLNAHIIKTHICDCLHQGKFELERLERSYRATVNAKHKLHANMQHSIKCQEPSILKLITTYNGLCLQLWSLIQQRQAPPYAVPPHIILCDDIFQLDIDDNIWQDVGLDDKVRNGIWLQLEVDQCNKEETQLMRERAVLQEWMLAE